MTHPEELLADYTDGTLDPERRAVVDAHLTGCEVCRDEIELARAATAALATLEEEPVPFGVTGPVLAEAGRRFEGRRAIRWERFQWAAGAAAAAALVIVVALNVGTGSDADRTNDGGATATEGAAAPEGVIAEDGSAALTFQGLERQVGVDYDDAGIRSIARDAAAVLTGQTADEAPAPASAPAEDALACIERSGAPTVGDPRDTLIRLLEAEYVGTPAYIAVYAESPGAAQPPDTVVVWAVAIQDCRILTTASLRL